MAREKMTATEKAQAWLGFILLLVCGPAFVTICTG